MIFTRQITALLKKDIILEYSYRIQFILTVAGVIFELAVLFFLSRFFAGFLPASFKQYGDNYFAFITVGMAFISYQGIGLHAFSQSLREQQVMGTLEMMLASPIRAETLVIGSSLWGFVFATIEIVVFLGLAWAIFGLDLSRVNLLSAVVVTLLTILAMSSFGILSAAFVVVFKKGDPVIWAFTRASELLGGVYYTVETLPKPLQAAAQFLPVTHALRAIRMAVLQGWPLERLSREIVALSAFSIVLLPISILAFRKAINIARREGTLSQY